MVDIIRVMIHARAISWLGLSSAKVVVSSTMEPIYLLVAMFEIKTRCVIDRRVVGG